MTTTTPLLDWYTANNIDHRRVVLAGHLAVNLDAATIDVEVFYQPDGTDGVALLSRGGYHARVLTRVVTVPLLVPPPAGLLDAYTWTTAKMRRDDLLRDLLRRLVNDPDTVPTLQLETALTVLNRCG